MVQSVVPTPQYIPIQQDEFIKTIKTSASIPEPDYFQQVEARLTFAIGEEPQNNPVKYRSWNNRRMAYIQCFLVGTALDWFTNLHISYKKQWNSFVKTIQKTIYISKNSLLRTMSLLKKDNEKVRHFALRVHQLVKKGLCKEIATTMNPKNNEIFKKGLTKKLRDFVHKRQVKHVSTLLEPSIPFHTHVRHVDSQDIANEKIRTNDLASEINKTSIEDDSSDKEPDHDHIMVTQSGDPNNKSKPAYKKIVFIVIKTIVVFQIVIKNNVMKNIKDIKIRDQELLNNPLYKISVVNPVIHKKIEI